MKTEPNSQNFFKGIKWTTIQQWSFFFINVVTTIILAKILSPNDFGNFVQASIIISFFIVAQDLSIGSIIIRDNNLTENKINSFLTVLILISMFFSIVVYIVAPYYTMYFTLNAENNMDLQSNL